MATNVYNWELSIGWDSSCLGVNLGAARLGAADHVLSWSLVELGCERAASTESSKLGLPHYISAAT
eukprot:scaffold28481_cov73-Skeletonema_marinoi.AAC.1